VAYLDGLSRVTSIVAPAGPTVRSPSIASRGLAILIDLFLLSAFGFALSVVLELADVHHNAEWLMTIVLSITWLPYSVVMLAETHQGVPVDPPCYSTCYA
jgi:hypothetical protein